MSETQFPADATTAVTPPDRFTLIQHSDHMADSYMGDVRVVRRKGAWAMAVRGAGGVWSYSGTGLKAEIVKLATMALPYKYPSLVSKLEA